MKRISTDEAYLEDKTLVVDADGIPVDLTLLNGDKAVAAAERAARIAESTSWNGDRLTVNGKTSPSLSGPRGPEGIGNTTTVRPRRKRRHLPDCLKATWCTWWTRAPGTGRNRKC